jgi:hypothetical protein
VCAFAEIAAIPVGHNRSGLYPGTGADKEILVQDEERLDSANAPICILNDEIPVIKSLLDRIFDDLVVAMILSLTLKRTGPTPTPR